MNARSFMLALAPSLALAATSCEDAPDVAAESDSTAAASESSQPGEESSSAPAPGEPDAPPANVPLLGARAFATVVYAKPAKGARRLGYLRVGAQVERSPEPVSRRGCKGGWYKIVPRGYVCAGADATTDLDDPLLRAAAHRPNLRNAMPYRYGFVRATLPMYLRVPTAAQQYKFEFKLGEHLEWFKEHRAEIQTAALGADDVPLDPTGLPVPNKRNGELGTRKNSTEMPLGALFGGRSDDDPKPFWLLDGQRLIPNISEFHVPQFAVFADRARRHTGLAFIGSFNTGPHSLRRRFAVTTDLRLAPTTKVKPDSASAFHGVAMGDDLAPPLAFVARRGAQLYRVGDGAAVATGDATHRSVHRLAGRQTKIDGVRYFQTTEGRWLHQDQASIVVAPSKWPRVARRGEKWIEIDLSEQVLVAWEGTKPVYATLVSSGRPAVGDPKETTASPRGGFRIISKHICATMDSDEGSGRRLNASKGLQPGDPGYVPTRGDGIYGVTKRRGEGLFKLRDVPYIQYFDKNYAIHGAYWHDVFGIPRSHGCINMAPIDAHWLFLWTEPKIPKGWHGINVEKGTVLIIHK